MSNLLTKFRSRAVDANFNLGKSESFTRYNGGHSNNRGHPFISGYWIVMIKIPDDFGINVNSMNTGKFLCSTAESFTPPTRSITKSDIIGFGGVKKQIVSGQDIGNTFNITFREYGYLPIFNTFSAWTNMINQYTGHITNKYKGQIAIGLLKPVGNFNHSEMFPDLPTSPINPVQETLNRIRLEIDLEEIFFFEGVFPETDPIEYFDGDISTNDLKTVEITFNYDGVMSSAYDRSAFINEFVESDILNMIESREI